MLWRRMLMLWESEAAEWITSRSCRDYRLAWLDRRRRKRPPDPTGIRRRRDGLVGRRSRQGRIFVDDMDSGRRARGSLYLYVPEHQRETLDSAGAQPVRAAHSKGEAFSYGSISAPDWAGEGSHANRPQGGRARDVRSRRGAELLRANESRDSRRTLRGVETRGCAQAMQSGCARNDWRIRLGQDC